MVAPAPELTCNAGMAVHWKTWAPALVSSADSETVASAAATSPTCPVRKLKEAGHLSGTCAVGAVEQLLAMPAQEYLVLSKDAGIPKPVESAEEAPVLPWEVEMASCCLVIEYQKVELDGQTTAIRCHGYLVEFHGSLMMSELRIVVSAAR